MRSRMAHPAAVAFALIIICACCALPAFAQDTAPAPAPTITAAPASEPPSDLQSAQAPAEEPGKAKHTKRLVLVPAYNMYYPTDAKTKSRFGDSWQSIGLSFAWRDKNTDPRKIELRLDGMGVRGSDRSAYIFPLGIGLSQRLSSSKSVTTYAGVSANVYFGKIKCAPDHVNTGWRMAAGPGAYLGANIGSRVNVQASYYLVSGLGGFGMSGLNLSAHVLLF